ncbi:uncharacterized protein [Henckelia pumila]|uniref:uncharacterized protein n=1 Tax=Henckelia pumila TaxID=405737 RepID=UPI003C6E3AF2
MKDVMLRKRKLEEFETVKLTKECSAILKKKIPQKLKDPEIFTIPCIIGGATVNRALCDLGASINLMYLSIFRSLELGEVKPTTITLHLADRSLNYPLGVVEDVLVKVDKFIFPADFVVLDMEEDQDVPLILGRPLLATDIALIDVQESELTLQVGGEAVTLNIYNTMKYQDEVHSCNHIDLFNFYENNFDVGMEFEDALSRCLINSVTQFDGVDWELREKFLTLESLPKEKEGQEKIEELPEKPIKEVPVSTPELKDLSGHLCSAFLGENLTYPVIISSSLTPDEKDKLLRVLRKFKSALGWSISDIKGISPNIFMHKILMEESYSPYVDHKRRLNLAMKEVVKAEVLKLFNDGIIYAISDSSWVYPVQVVPKK